MKLAVFFRPLALAESHAGAAAVLVDEFDAYSVTYFEMIIEFGFVLPSLDYIPNAFGPEPQDKDGCESLGRLYQWRRVNHLTL